MVFCLALFCSCASNQSGKQGIMSRIGESLDKGIDNATSKMTNVYMSQQARELHSIVDYSEEISLRKTDQMLVVVLETTFFNSGSTTLKPSSELDKVTSVLIRYAKTSLSVEGHTDSSGSESYNQKISKLRAEAVRNFLIEKGVDFKRIRAIGYGETNPIYSNDLKNRRVEIRVTLN